MPVGEERLCCGEATGSKDPLLLKWSCRTNSDSALHTSVMNPNPQDGYLGPSQGIPPPNRKTGYLDGDVDSKVFLFQVPSIKESLPDDGKQLLKPWDTKKPPHRPPGPKILRGSWDPYLPPRPACRNLPLIPTLPLTQGLLLPDLTNLHFPPSPTSGRDQRLST
uniref:Uncharacterized protein n=1 Tax=Sphaerodactylus townsendi TaxID=933632 RepID=A0ACB8G8I5_9SAUR